MTLTLLILHLSNLNAQSKHERVSQLLQTIDLRPNEPTLIVGLSATQVSTEAYDIHQLWEPLKQYGDKLNLVAILHKFRSHSKITPLETFYRCPPDLNFQIVYSDYWYNELSILNGSFIHLYNPFDSTSIRKTPSSANTIIPYIRESILFTDSILFNLSNLDYDPVTSNITFGALDDRILFTDILSDSLYIVSLSAHHIDDKINLNTLYDSVFLNEYNNLPQFGVSRNRFVQNKNHLAALGFNPIIIYTHWSDQNDIGFLHFAQYGVVQPDEFTDIKNDSVFGIYGFLFGSIYKDGVLKEFILPPYGFPPKHPTHSVSNIVSYNKNRIIVSCRPLGGIDSVFLFAELVLESNDPDVYKFNKFFETVHLDRSTYEQNKSLIPREVVIDGITVIINSDGSCYLINMDSLTQEYSITRQWKLFEEDRTQILDISTDSIGTYVLLALQDEIILNKISIGSPMPLQRIRSLPRIYDESYFRLRGKQILYLDITKTKVSVKVP